MQIEEYVAGNIKDLCKKRHVSKYRLAQLTGIAQSSLGRIVAMRVHHHYRRLKRYAVHWM